MEKTAIFTMGAPASGKSYIVDTRLNSEKTYTLINPDLIALEKYGKDSEENPSKYHDWATLQTEVKLAEAIAKGENIIIDTTLGNIERAYRRIALCQSEGYYIIIVYVRVSKQTALIRNAKRARTLNTEIIEKSFSKIATSFEILSSFADESIIINND